MKAAVYIRVSTDEQTEYSPKSQHEMIARYAATHAIELSDTHTYVDEGISGRTADRPAFQRMLVDARTKPRPFDLVLVWKFSRFARSRKDSIVCKAMLRQCGIEVVSVSEPLGNDSTAVLMEALLEAMDEYYSLNLAQEVRRGMEQKFREGGVVSRPPFGYRMWEGNFIPEEREANAVRTLFEGALAGRTLRSMADSLERSGVCRSDGALLTPRAIAYILHNPIYCGRAGRTLEGKWVVLPARQAPIVSEEIYDAVQCILPPTSRHKPNGKSERGEWMLRGLLVCSDCNGPLASAGNGYLQCSHYARGLCKVSHWVSREAIDRALTDALSKTDSRTLICTLLPRREGGEVQIDEALRRAERAYLAGLIELDEYVTQKSDLLARKQSQTSEGRLSYGINARFFAAFLQNERFSESEKRELVSVLFESVVFEKRERSLRIKWKAKKGD